MRRVHRAVAVAAILTLSSANLSAQVTETQVSFDTAGRVRVLTPAIVTRLQLMAPAWPVMTPFREARMFAAPGSLTLAVERFQGAIDRYTLPDSGAALRSAVNTALLRVGALAVEEQSAVQADPARTFFLRSQLSLAWGLYGPLLASLADDEKISGAITLLSVPVSFVVVHGLSRSIDVTRTQADLSLDGAFRGLALGAGALYLLAADDAPFKAYSAVGLASAIGGSVIGFKRGRVLTAGEAQASTTISTMSAFTALGVMGAAGLFKNGSERPVIAALMGASIGGYVIGPRYARQPGFSATKGDVRLLSMGAGLGVLTSLNLLTDENVWTDKPELALGVLTTGMLGGAYVGHRIWVRPFQNTTGDAAFTGLGVTAGVLAAYGVIELTAPSVRGGLALVTVGAIGGSLIGHQFANAPRARERSASIEFSPTSLGLAAARVPGRHAAVTIRF